VGQRILIPQSTGAVRRPGSEAQNKSKGATMRKSMTIAVAVILLAAVLPATAQVAGTWQGNGTGSCSPPSGMIHPWQYWEGFIGNDELVFEGTWEEEDGSSHGSFSGHLAPFSTPETVIFQGYWTLDSEEFSCIGGNFTMTFYYLEDECNGTWTSVWPAALPCTMWGKKIQD
jgi:hypothetical protein